jgi:hypothetical protein
VLNPNGTIVRAVWVNESQCGTSQFPTKLDHGDCALTLCAIAFRTEMSPLTAQRGIALDQVTTGGRDAQAAAGSGSTVSAHDRWRLVG